MKNIHMFDEKHWAIVAEAVSIAGCGFRVYFIEKIDEGLLKKEHLTAKDRQLVLRFLLDNPVNVPVRQV
jgi:hypothetical protein